MTGPGAADLLVVPAGEGRPVDRLHGEATSIVAGRAATRWAYAVRENSAPPGCAGVPLHIDRDAEEAFYVLSGVLALHAGGRRVDAAAGTFALVPRGSCTRSPTRRRSRCAG
jgi:uncharacterized cupin superfamily protein